MPLVTLHPQRVALGPLHATRVIPVRAACCASCCKAKLVTQTFDVAVIGATSLVGEAVLEILDEREFPVSRIFALGEGSQIGKTVSLGAEDIDVEDLANFDFSKVHLAIFASTAAAATAHVPRAAAAGCVVIDGSTEFRLDADVPLVVPEINPDAIGTHKGIIASPGSVSILMMLALKPLHDVAGIERIDVVSCQSVSGSGREGVEELAKQTADLLNFREAQPKVYPRQIAFNLIPQVGALLEDGQTQDEADLSREIHKILGDDRIAVNATSIRVPVLYGHSAAIHIQTRQAITAQQAREILSKAAGVVVMDEPKNGGYPTPATNMSGKDDVFVGRIREDMSSGKGLNLWVVTDNIRKGSALNIVQLAEVLVRNYL